MSSTSTSSSWLGSIAMSPGIGVFLGTAGDNKPHKHWAHQLAIGLCSNIEITANQSLLSERALWITAGTYHQLTSTKVLCIYIDPTHNLCDLISTKLIKPKQLVKSIDPGFIEEVRSHFVTSSDLQEALERFNVFYGNKHSSVSNPRLNAILDVLHRQNNVTRLSLAEMLHLSPSRFSHWFTENTGLPLRSYKKWLKLLAGLRLMDQMSLSDAAVTAGFSDQAHFSRAVKDAFGIQPTTIKKLLST